MYKVYMWDFFFLKSTRKDIEAGVPGAHFLIHLEKCPVGDHKKMHHLEKEPWPTLRPSPAALGGVWAFLGLSAFSVVIVCLQCHFFAVHLGPFKSFFFKIVSPMVKDS